MCLKKGKGEEEDAEDGVGDVGEIPTTGCCRPPPASALCGFVWSICIPNRPTLALEKILIIFLLFSSIPSEPVRHDIDRRVTNVSMLLREGIDGWVV